MGSLNYKDTHKKLGLCCDCSRPAVNGTRRCKIHLDRNSKSVGQYQRRNPEARRLHVRKEKANYRKLGRCPTCGGPRDDETKIGCVNCRLECRKPKMLRGDYAINHQNGSG